MIFYGGGDRKALCFDLGFLGGMGRWLECRHHALKVLGDKELFIRSKLHALKNGDPSGCCTQQFSIGFWTLYGSKYAT